jgi:hypothetical protein
MRLSESLQIIPILEPADYQAGSQDTDSINMGLLHSVQIAILLGAITGNDATIQLYAGASAGAKTTELPFKYRLSAADYGATLGDTFGAATAVAIGGSGLVLATAASYDHRTILIGIDAVAMPAGMPWLTVVTDDGSASALFMAAIAIGVPRYPANVEATTL